MPCYFVSNGVEIPMTNDTLTLFGTVLETKNSMTAKRLLRLKKIIKQIHHSKSPQNPNGESRMTDITTEQKTERRNVFPEILPRENEATLCMQYMRF